MNFEIGQIFEGEYPPEAAIWCNKHGDRWIEEVDAKEGVRRWQIVKGSAPSISELADFARERRDVLLRQTDFLVIPDYPIEPADLEAVRTYRQALRNLPQQAGFPSDIQWPDFPSGLRVSL